MRVYNGNHKWNIYKGSQVVYTGNSTFVALMYRVLQRFNKDYYVGDRCG